MKIQINVCYKITSIFLSLLLTSCAMPYSGKERIEKISNLKSICVASGSSFAPIPEIMPNKTNPLFELAKEEFTKAGYKVIGPATHHFGGTDCPNNSDAIFQIWIFDGYNIEKEHEEFPLKYRIVGSSTELSVTISLVINNRIAFFDGGVGYSVVKMKDLAKDLQDQLKIEFSAKDPENHATQRAVRKFAFRVAIENYLPSYNSTLKKLLADLKAPSEKMPSISPINRK